MANEAINSTSCFRLRSEAGTEMKKEVEETFSSCWSFDASVGAQKQQQQLPSSRTIDSWELDSSVYIGEGNATLVVSLPHERKVLRFRKSGEDSGETPAQDGGKRRVEFLVDFFKNVISGLMGSFASEPEIVRCHPQDVARWMNLFETQRPENRRGKRVVERYATTLPDYTQLPRNLEERLPSMERGATFCVEIKPKQGFVEEEVSLVRGVCDYCRKQYCKLAEGKISSTSKYCPCDLFSGDVDRMRRAVKGLVDSPQNNFRIFRNGRLVWGEGFEPSQLDDALAEWFFHDKPFDKEAAHEAMFRLIYEALLRPFPAEQSSISSTAAEQIIDQAVAPFLPRDSVLETILRVQRLNKHSMDFVYGIYSTYSKILNDEMIYSKRNAELPVEEIFHESMSMPSKEELRILRNYLLFRIAKDCSILIAFRQIDSSSIPVVPTESIIQIPASGCFLFKSAVTDLDPKSVHSIAKHHHRRSAEISKVAIEGQGAKSKLA